jgi:hypothetical protein
VTFAGQHVRDILELSLEHAPGRAAVVVSDARSGLARSLTQAYRNCLPGATILDFDAVSPAEIMSAFATLAPRDLVVLIQSTSFRLETFRIRVELFKRALKVIEHPHLARMRESEYEAYIDALAYDPGYFRRVGAALKERVDRAIHALVDSGDSARLIYESKFEPAKLNVGDYSKLANVGGQFPIGEVFSEPVNLERVHGQARIFAFGDTDFCVNAPDRPITLVIEGGQVVDACDSTPAFDRVLAQIRADESLWVRELGFGLNRALTPRRRVGDVGTYERMCGVHLSLGAKHRVYDKPILKRRHTKHHVDVFVAAEAVMIDGEVVFRDNGWCVGGP